MLKQIKVGFENVQSNLNAIASATLTDEEKQKVREDMYNVFADSGLGSPSEEELEQAVIDEEIKRAEAALESADQTAPVTMRDIINNEYIVPDKNLRELYKAELTKVFGVLTDELLGMQFPYCVFVKAKENKPGTDKREISSLPKASSAFSSYLRKSGAGLTFPITFESDTEKNDILQKLAKAETERTAPKINFFTLYYFNVPGGLPERSVREKDTERGS